MGLCFTSEDDTINTVELGHLDLSTEDIKVMIASYRNISEDKAVTVGALCERCNIESTPFMTKLFKLKELSDVLSVHSYILCTW